MKSIRFTTPPISHSDLTSKSVTEFFDAARKAGVPIPADIAVPADWGKLPQPVKGLTLRTLLAPFGVLDFSMTTKPATHWEVLMAGE